MHSEFIARVRFSFYDILKGESSMSMYVERLTKCGYTKEKAFEVCRDFIKNLNIVDLECFVWFMEHKHVC